MRRLRAHCASHSLVVRSMKMSLVVASRRPLGLDTLMVDHGPERRRDET
jgi:hypothetical protein